MPAPKQFGAEHKVWVGGLNAQISWEQLQDRFNELGKTAGGYKMGQKSACVVYESADDVTSAITLLNGSMLGDATLEVDVWTKKDTPAGAVKTATPKMTAVKKGGLKQSQQTPNAAMLQMMQMMMKQSQQSQQAPKKQSQQSQQAPKKQSQHALFAAEQKVWVGGLTEEITLKQLEDHFNEVGKVARVEKMSKKSALVVYANAVDATSAISLLNGSVVGEAILETDVWTQKERPAEAPVKAAAKNAAAKMTAVKKGGLKQSQQAPNDMMQMMMRAMMGQAGGAQVAKMTKPLMQQQPVENPKSDLCDFVRNKTGQNTTKDAIMYTTVEVEGSTPARFVSTVVLMTINPDKIYTGTPEPSKKAAEVSAAKVALRQNGQRVMANKKK